MNPVRVDAIEGASLLLADGRRLAPIGVTVRDDAALVEVVRIATLQGVIVERECGGGRARLLVEPRYYNWCGTSSWRWAGTYEPCPLGELLLAFSLAEPDYDDPDLTEHEARRMKALLEYAPANRSAPKISHDNASFRYDWPAGTFRNLDNIARWLDL